MTVSSTEEVKKTFDKLIKHLIRLLLTQA